MSCFILWASRIARSACEQYVVSGAEWRSQTTSGYLGRQSEAKHEIAAVGVLDVETQVQAHSRAHASRGHEHSSASMQSTQGEGKPRLKCGKHTNTQHAQLFDRQQGCTGGQCEQYDDALDATRMERTDLQKREHHHRLDAQDKRCKHPQLAAGA